MTSPLAALSPPSLTCTFELTSVTHRACSPAQVMDGTTIHLRNAPSPACTASLAIAETLADIAAEDFKWGPPKLK